jgi:hypothetical protein
MDGASYQSSYSKTTTTTTGIIIIIIITLVSMRRLWQGV